MSIFSKIMDAISWKGTRPTQTGQTPKPAPTTTPAAPSASTPAPAPTAPAPAPVSQFDVEANLSEMAQDKDLNWRTSIVDLMKLLGIDSSLANRKELAQELGYTGAC